MIHLKLLQDIPSSLPAPAPARGRRASGVGDGVRAGEGPRLRGDGHQEGPARAVPAGQLRRGEPRVHGAPEEPLGNGRLDRRLEPGVRGRADRQTGGRGGGME